MADPAPPSQIDGMVLRSMLNLIVSGTRVHRLSLEEACGRAWGYGRAYHAWLPAEALDEGVRHCCAQLRLVPPQRPILEIDGTALREVDELNLRRTISRAMSEEDSRASPRAHPGEVATARAAAHLVAQLRRRGLVVLAQDVS